MMGTIVTTALRHAALPLLLAGAAVATVVAPNEATTPPPADYTAEAAEIVRAEVARVSEGRPCVSPESLPHGTFPDWVAVSVVTGDLRSGSALVSPAVELVPLDTAWTGANAGRYYVRCVIVGTD